MAIPVLMLALVAGAADPAPVPARDARTLAARGPAAPVRVVGVVTAARPDGRLFVQDATGGLAVAPRQRAAVSPGDTVEVTGRPARPGLIPALTDATLRPADSPLPAPEPLAVAPDQLRAGGHEARLVRVSGWVAAADPTGGAVRVALADAPGGPETLSAVLPETLPTGARVELVGVFAGWRAAGGSSVPELFVRGPADVRVLEPARPAARYALFAVAGVAVLAVGCGVGFVARRRRPRPAPAADPADEPSTHVELLESAGYVVFATDAAGRLTEINRAGLRLLGCDPGTAVGANLGGFLDPERAHRFRSALMTRRAETFDLTLVPKSGAPVEVEVSVRPLPGGGLEGVARDISERKRLEAQLRAGQKLEAIGRLAGGIAHDFNNILTVINGCAELLQRESAGSPAASGLAGEIRRAGEKAAALTTQLLTFSRQRVVVPRPLDLNEVVRDTQKLLARLIREDVAIRLRLADGLPQVKGEAGMLTQILINLAVNARDAMPNGGELTIGTRELRDGWVQVRVTDTGTGMDAATQAKVFEPFFTTKEVGKGTGLGLATVYGAVTALGGRIRFLSTVGRGTTFEIDLPATASVLADPAAPAPASVLAPGPGAVVLLVEDDDAVRALAARVLETKKFRVLAADGPEEALRVASDHPGPIHLLMTDMVMPGMNGRELAAAVTAARPDVRVLFMSGYTADEIARDEVLHEQVGFLQKPFTTAGLAAAVRAALGDPSATGSAA